MKTFDDLTKKEKEKLQSYMQQCINNSIFICVLFLSMMMFVVVGLPLILLTTIPIVELTGYLLVLIGVIGFIFMTLFGRQQSKKLYLAYGYDRTFEDVFGITNKDTSKMKLKWIWNKED